MHGQVAYPNGSGNLKFVSINNNVSSSTFKIFVHLGIHVINCTVSILDLVAKGWIFQLNY